MSITYAATPDGPAATRLTEAELRAKWDARDALYAQGVQITDDQARAIRSWRMDEAGYVEPKRRKDAYSTAAHWLQPAGSVR